ncbi:cysteine-rich receptor-like protein kinase [Trifolium medium]|uniref:Cysteine-rich receptor-like protein kinase n=1 Tax=Trifolium medium TaxID=97028 RepID=A0A392QVT2_9FABA|nr:cysteine-rich receptor-like protein kinase [Trifolium medium]
MLVDKTGLWYQVLVARYGEEAGRLMVGGRRGSSWWKEIARIRDGVSVARERGWFEEGIVRRVGNGEETLFWMDLWLGGVPLSVRYRRLFDLSLYKSSMVAVMRGLGWEEGGGGRGAVGCGSGRRRC